MKTPLVVALLACSAIVGAPVLMISIDGMRPDSVTHAAEHGLKLPNLQRFVRESVRNSPSKFLAASNPDS
jgi:hypothetical protein